MQKFVEGEIEQFRADNRDLSEEEAQQQALVQVCRVVLNLNEFVYVE